MVRIGQFLFASLLSFVLMIGVSGGGLNQVGAASIGLKGISVSSSVTAGAAFTIKVSLSSAATSNTAVALSSNRPSLVTVPGTVSIGKGSKDVSIKVISTSARSGADVTITAKLGSIKKSDIVTVVGPLLTTVTAPDSLVEGKAGNFAVRMNGIAPAGGTIVTLKSSNSAAVPMPKSVTIPAGATGVSFRALAGDVTKNSDVTITASYNGVSVTDKVAVAAILLPTGSVSLTCPKVLLVGATSACSIAYDGTEEIDLKIGQTHGLVGYYCGEGDYCRASVDQYNTTADASLYADSPGTETITVAYNNAVIASATLIISASTPSLSCDVPVQVGQTGECTLSLSQSVNGDLTFFLYEDGGAGNIEMPESVTVPAGSKTVTFEFTGLQDSYGYFGIYADAEGNTEANTNLVISGQ